MKKIVVSSVRFLLVSVVLFGGLYTLLVTGIGQLLFSEQANGSRVEKNDKVVGSLLIGQEFNDPGYFNGRSQNVSQLAPNSKQQQEKVAERINEELQKNPEQEKVPNDLVTASASGVDPHISLAAAKFQAERIAKERQVPLEEIHAILKQYEQKDLFSNRKYVNVLQLNLALDKLS